MKYIFFLHHQLTSILPHFLSSSQDETTATSSDGICTSVVVFNRGVEFADIGYVLVSGETAITGKGVDLLNNPDVGRLLLGG